MARTVKKHKPNSGKHLARGDWIVLGKGYAETSFTDIFAAAKVSSGSFYHFFKSKEALLIAVLEQYKEMLHAVLLAPVYEKFPDPIDKIFGLFARYREAVVGTDCTYGCPIGRLSLEISPEYREAHKLLAENFTGWTDAVASKSGSRA